MSDSEMVTISRAVLLELIEDQDKLRKLEAYGVDNWEGYELALSDEGEEF